MKFELKSVQLDQEIIMKFESDTLSEINESISFFLKGCGFFFDRIEALSENETVVTDESNEY